jgi:hypothetical protein
VRDDLIQALKRLATERRHQFDCVIIETTGLADPAPVAQTVGRGSAAAPASSSPPLRPLIYPDLIIQPAQCLFLIARAPFDPSTHPAPISPPLGSPFATVLCRRGD